MVSPFWATSLFALEKRNSRLERSGFIPGVSGSVVC